MSKVFVIGAGGFLGRYICNKFCRSGYDVIGFDTMAAENAPTELMEKYFQTKVPGKAFVEALKEYRPNSIIHTAGRASVPLSVQNPREDFVGNVVEIYDILDEIRLNYSKSVFVLFSSAAVYGNPVSLPVSETSKLDPISPYGYHKLQAELCCKEYSQIFNVKTAVLRVFSAYGAGLRRQVLWDITAKAISRDIIELRGSGNESRDFVHARDVANAAHLVVELSDLNGTVFNVASGIETKIVELARSICAALGVKKELLFDQKADQNAPENWKADICRVQSLGFVPSVMLSDGIKEFVYWAKPLLM